MPLPIMELTISAARLQRPILRTKLPRAGFALCTTGVVTQISRKAYPKGHRRAGSARLYPVGECNLRLIAAPLTPNTASNEEAEGGLPWESSCGCFLCCSFCG